MAAICADDGRTSIMNFSTLSEEMCVYIVDIKLTATVRVSCIQKEETLLQRPIAGTYVRKFIAVHSLQMHILLHSLHAQSKLRFMQWT